ncbi:TOBE domain-containing protein [Bacillus sp. B15-48]|nr:TOBE domain-containing protein [Bacillus sp. B15-48]
MSLLELPPFNYFSKKHYFFTGLGRTLCFYLLFFRHTSIPRSRVNDAPSARWYLPNVDASFKRSNICPIRPEQFQITQDRNGLFGEVKNLLFQGREMHCNVSINGQEIQFVTDIRSSLKIGDTVSLSVTDMVTGAPQKVLV